MTVSDFLPPLFVQVGLTFALLWMTAIRRVGALRSGIVKPEEIALGEQGWPKKATQCGNAFRNQFELPVLFYVLIALILITRAGDLLLLVLAWLFVILRLAHAYVHTTSNAVFLCGRVYGGGFLVLMIMWIVFAFKILTAT